MFQTTDSFAGEIGFGTFKHFENPAFGSFIIKSEQ